MKKILAFFLCIVLCFTSFVFNINATDDEIAPYVVDFVVSTEVDVSAVNENAARVTGLIHGYSLSLAKSGTTLYIGGQTLCSSVVIKCGFKDLTIQRRKSSAYDWEDYYEFGNIYAEAIAANLETTLVVASGYQYRISCKHYAKKNILATQSISNTSNIVTVS